MTDIQKIAEALQDAEIVVLKALTKKPATTEELAKQTMLQESAVSRAALWLKNKELIQIEEKTIPEYALTELGEKDAKDSLPERRLYKVLKLANNPLHFDEIAERANLSKQETTAAIGYGKKNNYIAVKNGVVEITDYGKDLLEDETPEEKLLLKLAKEKRDNLTEEEKPAFDNLNKRGLAKLSEKKIRTFSINETAKRVISAIPAGMRVGQLSTEIIKNHDNYTFRRYDVETQTPKIYGGKKQAYRAFLDDAKRELISLGFQEMTGPLVEAELWNNDALFMPQDHPARGIHDVFFVKNPKYGNVEKYEDLIKNIKNTHEIGGKSGSSGWNYTYNEKTAGRLILRSQGTALSARTLASKDLKIPGAYFAISRVFRPEKVDATHLAEFDQCEGIVISDDADFQTLLGLLENFAKKFTGSDKVKFKPGYFPFTEPSVEASVWHPKLKKWVEILGAGILRPEVTRPLGIDAPVLAWGIGISRLFMLKEDITDIRQLFSQDLEFLRKTKL